MYLTGMSEPATVTSTYAPDVEDVRQWMERMIKSLRFAELVVAVVAFITRMRDMNTELTNRLADLRRSVRGQRHSDASRASCCSSSPSSCPSSRKTMPEPESPVAVGRRHARGGWWRGAEKEAAWASWPRGPTEAPGAGHRGQ